MASEWHSLTGFSNDRESLASALRQVQSSGDGELNLSRLFGECRAMFEVQSGSSSDNQVRCACSSSLSVSGVFLIGLSDGPATGLQTFYELP